MDKVKEASWEVKKCSSRDGVKHTWRPHVDPPPPNTHRHTHKGPDLENSAVIIMAKGGGGSLSHYLCAFCCFITSRHGLTMQTPTLAAPEE